MIYLDNSATTREHDEVRALVNRLNDTCFGNASSLHEMGFMAHNEIEKARDEIKKYFSGDGEIIFTSGGTESDNMAIISSCSKMKKKPVKIITSRIEHPAVLNTCKRLLDLGYEVIMVDNDDKGLISTEDLSDKLDENVAIVTIMTVNNEVGTIEPVKEISNIIKRFNENNKTNIIFHSDAVQAFGKIKMSDSIFDLVSISSHKIHGPKGVGALYMKNNLRLNPFITGGGQENGYRSGTENVAGIAGFGLATKMAYDRLSKNQEDMIALNNYLIQGINDEIKDVSINGVENMGYSLDDSGLRLPNILSISILGTRGEVILHTLEQDKIFVSTGSACSSHNSGESHVLKAMNKNHREIEGTIRLSFSENNRIEDMDIVIDRLKSAVNKFRRIGSFR